MCRQQCHRSDGTGGPICHKGALLGELPPGWTFTTADIHTGLARFWLHSDQAGQRAVAVTLTRACPETVKPAALRNVSETRTEQFPGGCVTYNYTQGVPRGSDLRADVEAALGILPGLGTPRCLRASQ